MEECGIIKGKNVNVEVVCRVVLCCDALWLTVSCMMLSCRHTHYPSHGLAASPPDSDSYCGRKGLHCGTGGRLIVLPGAKCKTRRYM